MGRKKLPVRFVQLATALAGLTCIAAFAQAPSAQTPSAQSPSAPAAPANAQGVPPGMTQIQPPKDPLVERREARKQASDEYKAKKKSAKDEYKQNVGAAKQERKTEDQAADAAAKEEMVAPKQ